MARMRVRTVARMGVGNGKPAYVVTPDPKAKIPREGKKKHHCGECFGPRSAYAVGPFCDQCSTKLFGFMEYMNWLRSEEVKLRWARRKAAKRAAKEEGS